MPRCTPLVRSLRAVTSRDQSGGAGYRKVDVLITTGFSKPRSGTPVQRKTAWSSSRPFGWWRRRESNPRPKALYRQFYMRSQVVWFNHGPADRQADTQRVTLNLTLHQVTRCSAMPRNDSALAFASRPEAVPEQSPAGIRPRERNGRRWRLSLFQLDLRGDWPSARPALLCNPRRSQVRPRDLYFCP